MVGSLTQSVIFGITFKYDGIRRFRHVNDLYGRVYCRIVPYYWVRARRVPGLIQVMRDDIITPFYSLVAKLERELRDQVGHRCGSC